MNDLFNQLGNFLFHTRNVLFPSLVLLMLIIWPPVPINHVPGKYFMILGMLFIALGQALRILTIGLVYIIRGGQKRRIYAEKLITDGVFSHCRNPLYVGNLLIVTGFMFISGNLTGMLVGTLSFMAIYGLIVHSEETFLRSKFGDAFNAFCADVPRWIPKLEGLRETIKQYDFDWPAVAVKEYGTIMTSTIIPIVIIAWKLSLANKLADYEGLLACLALLIMIAYFTIRFLKKTQRLRSMR